jgi:hypothetical protein
MSSREGINRRLKKFTEMVEQMVCGSKRQTAGAPVAGSIKHTSRTTAAPLPTPDTRRDDLQMRVGAWRDKRARRSHAALLLHRDAVKRAARCCRRCRRCSVGSDTGVLKQLQNNVMVGDCREMKTFCRYHHQPRAHSKNVNSTTNLRHVAVRFKGNAI